MKLKAIIFGATGMVGGGVLHVALSHPEVESILVIGRKSCSISHPKLTELLHNDFFDFSAIEDTLKGYNACFFCLGVSSVGMNEQNYTRTTYELTMQAARTLSRLNPDMTFSYVSGTGTDSTEQSRLMWARVKGRTENHLMQLPFKGVYCFRPGLMKPVDGQPNVKKIFKAAGMLYPFFKFISPKNVCALRDVGLLMIHVSLQGNKKKVLENADITGIARSMNN